MSVLVKPVLMLPSMFWKSSTIRSTAAYSRGQYCLTSF